MAVATRLGATPLSVAVNPVNGTSLMFCKVAALAMLPLWMTLRFKEARDEDMPRMLNWSCVGALATPGATAVTV